MADKNQSTVSKAAGVLGKIGGKAATPAKQQAAADNGKKGGRPKAK